MCVCALCYNEGERFVTLHQCASCSDAPVPVRLGSCALRVHVVVRCMCACVRLCLRHMAQAALRKQHRARKQRRASKHPPVWHSLPNLSHVRRTMVVGFSRSASKLSTSSGGMSSDMFGVGAAGSTCAPRDSWVANFIVPSHKVQSSPVQSSPGSLTSPWPHEPRQGTGAGRAHDPCRRGSRGRRGRQQRPAGGRRSIRRRDSGSARPPSTRPRRTA